MAPDASGAMRKLPEERRTEPGWALARFGDGGWWPAVRARPASTARSRMRSSPRSPTSRAQRRPPGCARSRRRGSGDTLDRLAERVAAALGVPAVGLLARAEERPPQREMANAVQQAANVRGAFTVRRSRRRPGPGSCSTTGGSPVGRSRWSVGSCGWPGRSGSSRSRWRRSCRRYDPVPCGGVILRVLVRSAARRRAHRHRGGPARVTCSRRRATSPIKSCSTRSRHRTRSCRTSPTRRRRAKRRHRRRKMRALTVGVTRSRSSTGIAWSARTGRSSPIGVATGRAGVGADRSGGRPRAQVSGDRVRQAVARAAVAGSDLPRAAWAGRSRGPARVRAADRRMAGCRTSRTEGKLMPASEQIVRHRLRTLTLTVAVAGGAYAGYRQLTANRSGPGDG